MKKFLKNGLQAGTGLNGVLLELGPLGMAAVAGGPSSQTLLE